MAEIDAADAPVVFAWAGEGRDQSSSYRLVDGALYGQVNSVSKRAACRSALDYPTSPVVGRAQASLSEIAAAKGHSMVVPPKGFHDPARWSNLDEFPPNACQEDIFEWEGRFTDCVKVMAVVDGALWRAVPDPLVVVYRNTSGWQTSVAHDVTFSQDLQRFHFSADRWAEAQAFCREMALGSGRPANAGRFTHDQTWVPTRETDAAEVRELAIRLASHISRMTNDHAVMKRVTHEKIKPKITWSDLPTDLFGVYGALRSVLDVPSDQFGEQQAGEAVECFDKVLAVSDRNGLGWLALQPEAYKAHIGKWNSRPIEFAFQRDHLRTGTLRP
ncbi:hypothetical protein HFO56_33335 [Rhizobium laguerreae]|uniref:hypothetical protein n=1 Tax=Rhizobium laguerreae TaxID=1076926 RepID=UPI001C903484|nr:hypothetical protein [Rhizobium laguerreae]MBY3157210.1 hypothetical protein [Rhizobium laguerreae]